MYIRYSETVTKRNRFITNKNMYKTMNIDIERRNIDVAELFVQINSQLI